MDNFLNFLGVDWLYVVAAIATFVIGYVLKNAKLKRIMERFNLYWGKAGAFLDEFEDVVTALKALHQEAAIATKDGKLDPDEVQRLIDKGERLIKEAKDLKEVFAPPATE